MSYDTCAHTQASLPLKNSWLRFHSFLPYLVCKVSDLCHTAQLPSSSPDGLCLHLWPGEWGKVQGSSAHAAPPPLPGPSLGLRRDSESQVDLTALARGRFSKLPFLSVLWATVLSASVSRKKPTVGLPLPPSPPDVQPASPLLFLQGSSWPFLLDLDALDLLSLLYLVS